MTVYHIAIMLHRENSDAEIEPEVLRRTSARLHPGQAQAFKDMMEIRARELVKDADWFNKAK